jgi:deazaflavin-dependent oxidoreductase (nitroreductase family)
MGARRARVGRRQRLRTSLTVVGGVAAFLVVAWSALTFGGRRTKDAIRVVNKWALNPVMLRFAGRRHWYAAVLRHTGRKSGRRYATPVVAVPVEGGFVIPLPYGEGVDWLKNVRAADGAGLRFDGQDYELRSPEVVSASAVPDLDEEHLRVWQHYRIDRVVRLSSTPAVAP